MQQLITGRNFALLLALADLWRARVYDHGIWYVLMSDGLALVLIFFAEEIDDLTFGQWVQGMGMPDKIDVHTPPFLIAFFGWVMLLLNTAMLFFTHWLRSAGAK